MKPRVKLVVAETERCLLNAVEVFLEHTLTRGFISDPEPVVHTSNIGFGNWTSFRYFANETRQQLRVSVGISSLRGHEDRLVAFSHSRYRTLLVSWDLFWMR